MPQVTVGGEERRQVVGYLTVYEYYAYGRTTNHKRPRIAQMVGGGAGAHGYGAHGADAHVTGDHSVGADVVAADTFIFSWCCRPSSGWAWGRAS